MNEDKYIKNYVKETKRALDELVKTQTNAIRTVTHILRDAQVNGKFVYIMGNGGSSAAASHLASDLNKTAGACAGARFRAISLTDNVPVLTALANDMAYPLVFEEQLVNFMREGDVVIAFSGSGNSENVCQAMQTATKMKATTIGITGGDGGLLRMVSLFNIIVPSNDMQCIEDIHMLIIHLITSMLRDGID